MNTRQLQLFIIESARMLAYGRGNKQVWISELKAMAKEHLKQQLADCVGKPLAVVCLDEEHFGQQATLVRIDRFAYHVRTEVDEFVTSLRHLRSATEEQAWLELVQNQLVETE